MQDLVAQVLASAMYGEQRKSAQRVTLTDDQVARCWGIWSPGQRVPVRARPQGV